jgi:hypothetical protein
LSDGAAAGNSSLPREIREQAISVPLVAALPRAISAFAGVTSLTRGGQEADEA